MTEASKPTYKYLVSVDDFIEGPGASWLIEEILPSAAQVVLYALPGAYKTFIALGMMRAIVTGDPFCGFETKQKGCAIYFALEGTGGARKRVEAALQGIEPEERKRAKVVTHSFRMPDTSKPDWDKLLIELKEFVKDNGPLRLIIIDTFASFSEVDENSATQVSRLLCEIAELIKETGATVCEVHHAGKPTRKKKTAEKMRGSSALLGAADTVIVVDRIEGSLIASVRCEKQRDFDWFEPFEVELEEVTLPGKTVGGEVFPDVSTLRVKGRATGGAVGFAKRSSMTIGKTKPKLESAKAAVLSAVGSLPGGQQHKDLKAALVPKLVSSGTFNQAMRELEEECLISKADDGCWVKASG